jgi:hypothetical protein
MTNISFFKGTTYDGSPYVISIEGGPTATDQSPGVGSGLIVTPLDFRKVRGLTARQALWLHHNLSLYSDTEVHEALCRARKV